MLNVMRVTPEKADALYKGKAGTVIVDSGDMDIHAGEPITFIVDNVTAHEIDGREFKVEDVGWMYSQGEKVRAYVFVKEKES